MRRRYTIIALLAAATAAHADPKKQPEKTPTQVLLDAVDDEMNWGTPPDPVFAWQQDKTHPLDSSEYASLSMGDVELNNPVVGFSASGNEAFVAGDIRQFGDCGGSGNCGVTLGWLHGAMLCEKQSDGVWRPIVWSIAKPGGEDSSTFPRKIVDADAAAKVFEATIADPKAFVKTVSDRKEVVLIGSDKGERFVGSAKVRARLTKWNLTFTVRDGLQAGLAQGKTLAWVAANVDARPVKKPKANPTQYRMLAIYEKTGDSWKLVSLMFS